MPFASFSGFRGPSGFNHALRATSFLALSLIALAGSAGNANAGAARERRDEYERIYDATILNRGQENYWQEINSGWSPNLSPLRASLRPNRSYMVIHIVEPDPVYDLRSTEHLRKGIIARGILKLMNPRIAIGHVFTSWRCHRDGRMVEGTTGLTGETEKQFFKMLTKGFGMTAFFSHFTDGHLQTPKLLDQEFDSAKVLHNVAIEVSDEVCSNAMGFVHSFLNHPSRPYENFGPNLDPTQYQGGGCGSFGVSILEKSGLWGKHLFWPHLWRELRAPLYLFGYGIDAPEDTKVFSVPEWDEGNERNRISLANLLRKEWVDTDGGGFSVRQQDPEMLLLILKTLYRLNHSSLSAEFRQSDEYQPRTFKQKGGRSIEINSSFDPKAAGIAAATKSWWAEKKSAGYRARMGRTSNFPAVILDRK